MKGAKYLLSRQGDQGIACNLTGTLQGVHIGHGPGRTALLLTSLQIERSGGMKRRRFRYLIFNGSDGAFLAPVPSFGRKIQALIAYKRGRLRLGT